MLADGSVLRIPHAATRFRTEKDDSKMVEARANGLNTPGEKLPKNCLAQLNLYGANLEGVDLTDANLSGAKYDAKTVFLDGSQGENNSWIQNPANDANGMIFIKPETKHKQ